MVRRLPPIVLLFLLGAATTFARPARIPLDPASLAGAEVFTDAEQRVASAAQAVGLAFAPDPRPLPPQVLLTFDTPDGKIRKRNGLLYWRGDMLPDQLAPGETGTFVRRHRNPDGAWRTTRTQEDAGPASNTNLVPVAHAAESLVLPPMIIETAYQLGTAGESSATLVLWRAAEEDSAPLGGFIALEDPSPDLLDALNARCVPFETQADWAAAFDAFAR